MLTRRDVSIGKCYIKDKAQIAREVIAVTHHRKVVYNVYNLRTGKLLSMPHQICPRNQMIRWADREATPEEYAKLERDEAVAIFESKQNQSRMDDALIETTRSQSLTEIRHLTPAG
jgi:hypothetical protein